MIEIEHDRLEWIALTAEEPLDSARRIVDAHHHLWSRDDTSPYLLDELLLDTRSGHNVTDTVFVECHTGYWDDGPDALRPVGETDYIATLAQESEGRDSRIAVIVGRADLTLGDAVDEVVEAHELAGAGRFRGVRHATLFDPDLQALWGLSHPPGLLGDERFRRGVARLGTRGHTFDALVFHPQLVELAGLAHAVEGTTVVVEHLGYPLGVGPYADRRAVRSVWRSGLQAVAGSANTVLKLGGIGMDFVFGTGWSTRQRPPGSDEVVEWWGEDIRWCIDTFGPSRCMFESNYPVDRNSLGYTVMWNAFQKIAAEYSDDEQDALFAGTAARVYRIAG